jgi:hypothetical protein
MIARVLAVLAALAMIVGAFVYRYGSPFDGGSGNGHGDGSNGTGSAEPAVVCAAELGQDVCDAIDAGGRRVVVEPAATTADRLIKARGFGDADVAGWLAPGPWAAMVNEGRRLGSKAVLFNSKGRNLADTPLVAVSRKGQVLPGCDPAAVTWRCIGDASQQPATRIGADPPSSSSRLFLRAAALDGLFGNATWATNDLDAPPEGTPDPNTWLGNLDQRLGQAPGFGAPTLGDFVVKPGSVTVFLTTGAAATGAPASSFDARTPTPAVKIAATYTAAAQGGHQIDTDRAAKALATAGWTVQSGAKNEGLPSPGVLLALREP